MDLYPEIYGAGTSEGSKAVDYFTKWGWYASIVSLANDNLLRIKKVLKKTVIETHIFLAHRSDKNNLETYLRTKANNTNTLEL